MQANKKFWCNSKNKQIKNDLDLHQYHCSRCTNISPSNHKMGIQHTVVEKYMINIEH